MVNLAEQWTNVPPQHICKSDEINEERPIDPTYGYTLSAYMDVTGCAGSLNEVRFLEHVQCKVRSQAGKNRYCRCFNIYSNNYIDKKNK